MRLQILSWIKCCFYCREIRRKMSEWLWMNYEGRRNGVNEWVNLSLTILVRLSDLESLKNKLCRECEIEIRKRKMEDGKDEGERRKKKKRETVNRVDLRWIKKTVTFFSLFMSFRLLPIFFGSFSILSSFPFRSRFNTLTFPLSLSLFQLSPSFHSQFELHVHFLKDFSLNIYLLTWFTFSFFHFSLLTLQAYLFFSHCFLSISLHPHHQL